MSRSDRRERRTALRLLAAGSVAGAIVLTGCSSSGGSSGGGSGNIGVIIKGLDNPFFQTMKSGVDAAATADDVTVQVQAATSITDTTGQADKLNALANQNYSCFVVNPISGTNLVQGIARIAAKGTPIVNIDSPVDAKAAAAAKAKIATYIGTDNTAAGKMAGEEMAKLRAMPLR